MGNHITTNADGSVTIALASGIEIAGARVKVLTLREPTVADQIAAQSAGKGAAEVEVALISNLAQVAPDEVKSMTLRDYRRVQDALVGFTA